MVDGEGATMPRKKLTPKPRDRGISRGEDARTDRDPRKVGFLPDVLDSTVIAVPLLKQFKERDAGTRSFHVAIDLNLDYKGGIEGARGAVFWRR